MSTTHALASKKTEAPPMKPKAEPEKAKPKKAEKAKEPKPKATKKEKAEKPSLADRIEESLKGKSAAELDRIEAVAVKQAADAIARLPLSKEPEIAAVYAEQKIEVAAKAACAAQAAHEHPAPKARQIWSWPTTEGRTFMRIEEVRLRATEDAYVNFVRVSDATGAKLAAKSKASPFAGLVVKHKLVKGQMEPGWRYEGDAPANAQKALPPEGEPAPKAEKKAKAPKAKAEKPPKEKKESGEKKPSPYTNREGRRSASNEEIVDFIAKAKAKDPEVSFMDCLRAFITPHRFSSHMRFRPLFKATKAAKK